MVKTPAEKLFVLMLLAYPRQFRREYGPLMTQHFRDCYRTDEHWPPSFWLSTVLDLLAAAPREHLETLRTENSSMTNLQRNLLALGTSLVTIVAAFFLLTYGRSHEVSSILFFGKTLDALVTAGILGNLIIFLLRLTRLDQLKTAFWVMLTVNSILLILAWLIGSRVDRTFSLGSIAVAQVVSFLFWFGLHWAWSKTKTQAPAS
jgi:hypothetical protein